MDKYIGFYIDKPTGNNIFSYEERSNKKIFVPKLIQGTLDDVLVGNEIVFNEIDEDIEIKAKPSPPAPNPSQHQSLCQ